MDFKPEEDGITHINIYSKSRSEFGRFLSNFAHTPVDTEDGKFQSIEGYWYWLSCKDDKLRELVGFWAKKYGRQVGAKDRLPSEEFQRKIKFAIDNKIFKNPNCVNFLTFCNLPFTHYYIFGGKVVEPKEDRWVIEHIDNIRKELQHELYIMQQESGDYEGPEF